MNTANYDDCIRLTVKEAQELFPDVKFRITNKDGKPVLTTRDYKFNRVNVSVQDNRIVGVNGRG